MFVTNVKWEILCYDFNIQNSLKDLQIGNSY
jgi:hypothetical protein